MTAVRLMRSALILGLFSLLAACSTFGGGPGGGTIPVVNDPAPIVSGTMRPYQVRGRWYTPKEQPNYEEVGMASWYGDAFNGRPTSTGERFNMHELTAAHKTLPLPGLVEVTNLENGRRVVVRINDRGPFVDGRIIDLSRGAAQELGMISQGVGRVRVRYLGQAPRLGGGVVLQQAEVRPARTPPASQPVPYTAIAAASPPIVAPPPMAQTGGVWVQAGAFADPRAARRIAQRLGDRATVQPTNSGGRELYRVVVGPWEDATAAESARQAVVARGYADALLISSR
ncbi:septal ring lytic transglycosylase RlpA family protein [Brevundimonas nasdae]|uniref:Endolytic peptidoglycan transglycosylase RlpA n=2 Tax=Brevundimonas nasdae TaxID=172043 RepID=A0ABX8TLW2_9CAUL|nr:septal ring lytic transglycosylase RlpA family protein [Brevundimonas nasdae]QYC14362.1 septal ring lytic transglycosylase RlpA family protein [Brevundimonas nasdae]